MWGAIGAVFGSWMNERAIKYRKLRMNLKVPAGFKLLSGNVRNELISQKKNPDGSVNAVFNVQSFVPGMKKDGYGMWSAPSVTLIPEVGKSDKLYPLEYQLEEGAWKGEVKKLNSLYNHSNGSQDNFKRNLPELPEARRARFVKDFEITPYDAQVLTQEKPCAEYFEAAASKSKAPKLVANWIIAELMRELAESGKV